MSFYLFKEPKDGKPAQLLLDGEIVAGGWAWDGDVDAQAFARELNLHGDIDVIINSPGGDVFAGAMLYTLLKAHSGHVRILIAGMAASIASVIAMAGDEILISPAGYMMIHQPWMRAAGNAAAFEKAAEQLREVSQGIVNAYQIRTGMEEDEIRKLLDDETYMNAQSAIEMGFADGLWEFDRNAYQSAPASKMAGSRYGETGILNRITKAFPKASLPEAEKPTENPQAIADLKKRRLRLMALAMEKD